MKQKILFLLFFILLSASVFAQREMTWWYFGFNTGLDFTKVLNSEATVPEKVSGPISTSEGCFTISDYLGNFLIASDGTTVYNKNKAVMDGGTGLLGNSSSSQSGIIIPRPGYLDQYYIVTVPAWNIGNTTAGINYSIVDLSQNGGLGKVTSKNNLLNLGGGYPTSATYENIASVQHSDGINYWLVHHSRQYFHAWLVTENGIGPNPTKISDIGYDPGAPSLSPLNDVSPGSMKFSKDGTRIAHAGWHGMTMGQFNTSDGSVTGISYRTNIKPYSCEFSPSGEYLYFGNQRINTNASVATQTPVTVSNYITYGLQLGPDDKIYAFDRTTTRLALWVINNPDQGGTNVSYYDNFFVEGDLHETGRESVYNFPTFATSTFRFEDLNISPPEICMGKQNEYSLNVVVSGSLPIHIIEWDFGDGTVIDDTDFSNSIHTLTHVYNKRGTYTLTITPYRDAAKTDPITEHIITKSLRIKSCRLPVNHNISAMGYYD